MRAWCSLKGHRYLTNLQVKAVGQFKYVTFSWATGTKGLRRVRYKNKTVTSSFSKFSCVKRVIDPQTTAL